MDKNPLLVMSESKLHDLKRKLIGGTEGGLKWQWRVTGVLTLSDCQWGKHIRPHVPKDSFGKSVLCSVGLP